MNADTKMILDEMKKMQADTTKIFGVLGEMNKRLDGMDARFDGMDARFDGMDARLDGMDARLDGMDARFDGMDARFDGMDARFDGIEARLENVEHSVQCINLTIENEIKRDIHIIAESHLDLANGIKELQERESKYDKLAIDVLWLKNKVGAM